MNDTDTIKPKQVFRLTLPFEDYQLIEVSSQKNLEFNTHVSDPMSVNEEARMVTFELTFRQVHSRNTNQMLASFLIRTFKGN
jgi:hypothetical protein